MPNSAATALISNLYPAGSSPVRMRSRSARKTSSTFVWYFGVAIMYQIYMTLWLMSRCFDIKYFSRLSKWTNMPKNSGKPVGIVGTGRVGRTLDGAFRAAGCATVLIRGRWENAPHALSDCDVAFLAVPDGEIRTVARRLAEELSADLPPLAHLSGALSTDELAAFAPNSTPVGSFHPFLPFSTAREPAALHGVTIGIEASTPELHAMLEHLARQIQAVPRAVPKESRALYHAAAVTASAQVVALASHASTMLTQLGWTTQDALATLLPLISGTVTNLSDAGLPGALSGPLRRGDASTIKTNLEALRELNSPTIEETYRLLSLTGIELAESLGLEPGAVSDLRDVVNYSRPSATGSGL